MSVEENLKAISDVDRAFNEKDWGAFNDRHADDVLAYSPITPEPTKGIDPHREAVKGLLSAFPDLELKQEFSFGQGDWVCAVYSFQGTHGGPLQGPGGQEIPPTNKPIKMSFCSALKMGERQDRRRARLLGSDVDVDPARHSAVKGDHHPLHQRDAVLAQVARL